MLMWKTVINSIFYCMHREYMNNCILIKHIYIHAYYKVFMYIKSTYMYAHRSQDIHVCI